MAFLWRSLFIFAIDFQNGIPSVISVVAFEFRIESERSKRNGATLTPSRTGNTQLSYLKLIWRSHSVKRILISLLDANF